MYYIVYPRSDKTRLRIIHLDAYCLYEINDYSVASRREFYDNEREKAVEYAKDLARRHNLKLDSNCGDVDKELNYLD